METVEIYNSIYRVFCSSFKNSTYIFLCGGTGKDHIRNKVRPFLEKKQFRILYPEDLFMEMLNKDKKSDLLRYENFLADNSDIICVICESFGSAVELGVFVQNESIKRKIVIGINKKYSRDKSFVMMGPVKHIRQIDADSIVVFNKDEPEDFSEKLSKAFKHIHKKKQANKNPLLATLSSYITFIPMILFFYKELKRKQLHSDLKCYLKYKGFNLEKYNDLFNSTIKYLCKTGIIKIEYDKENEDEKIFLSDKGYIETNNSIKQSTEFNRTLLHDKIRCDILKM